MSRTIVPKETRFWAMVDKTPACWNWTGTKIRYGYGMIRWGGRMQLSHRVSYIIHVGDLPADACIDHICHNKSCVRPDHLRVATISQNQENYAGHNSANTSGVRGVSWRKRDKKWIGQVSSKGKRHYVGRFDSLDEAASAVKSMRLELHTFNDADRA